MVETTASFFLLFDILFYQITPTYAEWTEFGYQSFKIIKLLDQFNWIPKFVTW